MTLSSLPKIEISDDVHAMGTSLSEKHRDLSDDLHAMSTALSDEHRDLSALFDPRSIAIVGASDDPAKFGNWLARRALRNSAVRSVHLINRARPSVMGQRTLPSICAVGEHVDLAVIAVPAAAFEASIDDAVTAGVSAIVAITAGLGESGPDGLARQNALVGRLRTAGVSMLGPNCLGVLDNTTGLDAAVNDFEPGPVAIISQSGNVAIDIARHLGDLGLGVSRFASLGNCADLDVADLVDSCVDHDGTSVIAVYCEGFRDGRKFARAAARATSVGKPVLLLSVGRSAASTRGAASHTGSLVTSEVVVRAVCEATGAAFVASPLEMANLVQALLRTRIPVGRRVGVLADGGGHASLTSDALMDAGLHVEDFSARLKAAVAAEVGPRATVSNPIDLAGEGERDITCFTRVAERLVEAPEVDAVVMTGFFGGYTGYNPAIADAEVQVGRDIAALVNETGATFVVQTAYADSAPACALRAGGVAVYRDVEHAAWALGRVVERSLSVPQRLTPMPAPAAPLTETGYWVARRALASAGVPFVAAAEVRTFDELQRAVLDLRYPLVLKALGDDHKSDNGGVILNIDNTGLVGAWQDVQTRLAPPVCSIEEMAEVGNAVELIVGVRRDPAFGPVVLVGIGGVYAELLKDTRCALGPVTPQRARDLLLSLRGSSLLTGFRGGVAVDLDSAAELVSILSRYAAAHPEIAEMECNPIAVSPHGALALDARIVLEEAITCLR